MSPGITAELRVELRLMRAHGWIASIEIPPLLPDTSESATSSCKHSPDLSRSVPRRPCYERRALARDRAQTRIACARNLDPSTKSRCQSFRGSCANRYSHSNPELPIHAGARLTFPLRKPNAAPTAPAIGMSSRVRCSAIHNSCLGSPKTTDRTSGFAR